MAGRQLIQLSQMGLVREPLPPVAAKFLRDDFLAIINQVIDTMDTLHPICIFLDIQLQIG